MTREEAIKILRREIECLSHTKCEDCILEVACDPIKTTPYDSEYIEVYEMAISALSENKGDLISRQAVENITWEEPSYSDPLNVLTEVREKVRALPSVENKGEWIVREDNTSFVKQIPRRWVECSHCGWSFSYDRIRDDFCSKCGADMRGGE